MRSTAALYAVFSAYAITYMRMLKKAFKSEYAR
nr:MAG TPA_asm: hypothetical protein [Bacteriophage sp.]